MDFSNGFHLIECPWSSYPVNSCAIVGEKIVLVDVGKRESPESAIYPYLRSIGREPSEISHIILTHTHFDHCGGVAPIKRKTGCKVCVHELGKPFVEDASLIDRQLNKRFPTLFGEKKPDFESVKVDMTFKDGNTIDVEGHQLKVLHVPGHSACSSVLVEEELGVYISGDSIQGRGYGRPLLFQSVTKYIESMMRLLKKPINLLVTGHPFPPFKKSILKTKEAEEHLHHSLKAIKELEKQVSDILAKTKKPTSISELHKRINVSPSITIGVVLEKIKGFV
jgi:glyoxylase-like metal-dependent hydrolase (beta-lactamase superfamily II)